THPGIVAPLAPNRPPVDDRAPSPRGWAVDNRVPQFRAWVALPVGAPAPAVRAGVRPTLLSQVPWPYGCGGGCARTGGGVAGRGGANRRVHRCGGVERLGECGLQVAE